MSKTKDVRTDEHYEEARRLTKEFQKKHPDREVEIIPCHDCGEMTSFERLDGSMPHEGEKCDECDAWCCPDCLDENHVKAGHDHGTF